MIDKMAIYAETWNSCDAIDEAIDYLNTLPLNDDQFKKLQRLFGEIINAYSGVKEGAWGDDT